ncbi:hypothetical protein SAMD00019534_000740 [Acytostelium subglobosum LB1]|uniref:hypothetical protein n=1 Tax=Acytostelium subglobosum LB1 TaxID=1410327 RepID=UPI000644FD63|nr:hypothetical protein SAMD00019534_000740 [Acytostelium subglobosum LB1]GAM16899.1 hypothetical protein SAMD00019534_000740 [Acytostelium subglobosum LB1]|eukprot:XP_012758961.1 hypothetical protein SAMD00019534_000740 [Acytostelium subglobosum LB1]
MSFSSVNNSNNNDNNDELAANIRQQQQQQQQQYQSAAVGGVNSLVIGLNKSFQSLNIDNNQQQQQQQGTSTLITITSPLHFNEQHHQTQQQHNQLSNSNNAVTTGTAGATNTAAAPTVTTFKTAVLPNNRSQKPRALSPLSKEKQRVSFSPLVEEFATDNNVHNSNNNNNNNNNSNVERINDINNSIGSSAAFNMNNNMLNSNNINNFIDSLNNVSMFGRSGREIFQFDEEFEEEVAASETSRVNEVEMSMDDDDEPQHVEPTSSNRLRSNDLVQEIKLGTSLPMEIPSRLAQSLQKNSFATMDIIPSESEKKKHVTPRQSWVDTLHNMDNDEMAMSFAVPTSLSKKPKSFI